jgi:predicted ATPase
MARRLEDSLRLLTADDRTAPPKQQTLRGTLDWSHELLDASERKLFARLAVFAGGWALEAAEMVGAGDGIEEGEVLDLLSKLVEKSLVMTEPTEAAEMRYRMLEPVGQYAQEKLGESGEIETVRRQHAALFLTLAEEAEPELLRPEQKEVARAARDRARQLAGGAGVVAGAQR